MSGSNHKATGLDSVSSTDESMLEEEGKFVSDAMPPSRVLLSLVPAELIPLHADSEL